MSKLLFNKCFSLDGFGGVCVDSVINATYVEAKPKKQSTASPPKHRKGQMIQFKVHRIVVSALSEYMRKSFRELEEKSMDEQNCLTIEAASNESQDASLWPIQIEFSGERSRRMFEYFPMFIDFLYGRVIQIQESNVFELLELGNRFGAPKLISLVSDFLVSSITRDSSFSLLRKSIEFDAPLIQSRCLELIARNFQTIFPTIKSELNSIPLEPFTALVHHPSLSVPSEYRLYKIIRSYYYSHENKDGVNSLSSTDRSSLFSAVRLPYVKYLEMEKIVRDDVVPKTLLTEALMLRLAFVENPNATEPDKLPLRLKRRTMGRVFEPTSDMDTNGVLYYLATNFGRSDWKNPSLTGSIKVSSSSNAKGKTHNFVDRDPQDCWTMDIPASWVAIDLRQGKLIPSFYTLRHGGNSKMDTLRNWVLQACDGDGDKWQEISRHTNDASLQGAFGTHTWKINLEVQRPYRQFRILQNGHNSGNTNFLALSGIEFYGTFFPKSQP